MFWVITVAYLVMLAIIVWQGRHDKRRITGLIELIDRDSEMIAKQYREIHRLKIAAGELPPILPELPEVEASVVPLFASDEVKGELLEGVIELDIGKAHPYDENCVCDECCDEFMDIQRKSMLAADQQAMATVPTLIGALHPGSTFPHGATPDSTGDDSPLTGETE